MTVWISSHHPVTLPTGLTWSNARYWVTIAIRLLKPSFDRFDAREAFAWELDIGPVSIVRIKTEGEIEPGWTS